MSFPRAFGPYTLLARIASGGMAEVFRARNKKYGHFVGLKKILPHIAEDEEFISMFEDEARIVSRLEHPHIARMLDFGRVDGSFYIAFEYVHGKDLRAVFERSTQRGMPVPLPFILYVFSRIGEGLSYAHARRDENGLPSSIVHRDISPQNIVVSTTGDVKLVDFGIAKAQGKISRTQVGSIKGSFGYMSPEQACGAEVDAQADVFGMGVCLWEFLTQKRLFDGENEFLILQKIRDAATVAPPSTIRRDTPPELDRVVMRALSTDLDTRQRSAKELYRELQSVAMAKGAVASRAEVAAYMRHLFPELTDTPLDAPEANGPVSTGPRTQRIGWPEKAQGGTMSAGSQEITEMSSEVEDDNSEDDTIAAGRLPPMETVAGKVVLKRDPRQGTSAQSGPPNPPSPPVGRMRSDAPRPTSPVAMRSPARDVPLAPAIGKRTLLGVHAAGAPGELTSSDLTPVAVPFSASTPLHNAAYPASAYSTQQRQALQAGATLPLDWDDEHEASNVLDNADRPSVNVQGPPSQRRSAAPRITPAPPPPAPPPVTQRGGFRTAPPTTSPPPPLPQRGSGSVPVASGYNSTPPPSRRYNSPAPFSQPLQPMQPPASVPPPSSGFPRRATPLPIQAGPISTNPAPAYGAPPYPPPMSRYEPTALVRPPPNRTWLFVLLAAALLVVSATTLLIVFVPRTGKVAVRVSDPKGMMYNRVEIFLDGKKQCDTSPCLVEGVSAGAHNVKVLGADGSVSERAVVAESRKEVPVDVVLASNASRPTTGLRVAANQPGMKLLVDGREAGLLPQEVRDLSPGEHKIRIVGNERYEPLERVVTLAKDEMQDLGSMSLKVLRGKVTITLGTPGAKVYLVSGPDRRDLPTFPISVDIDTSNKAWNLEASRFGFSDYRQPISFADGQAEKTFNVQLEPKVPLPQFAAANPRTAPAAPPPAKERSEGPTMLPDRNAPAAAASDYSGTSQQAGPGGEAFLNINSIPASSVVLDGKPIGSTPKVRISVPPGNHTVVFVNAEQGLRKSVQVSVAAGDTKPVIGKLRE
ncbi:protein kinase [Pendulispora rubella]|uniref:Protein kinase n=1 Tax=Pendulispora rubella TaxID=2741070 RepID=A0ABZ2LCT6_9BACT